MSSSPVSVLDLSSPMKAVLVGSAAYIVGEAVGEEADELVADELSSSLPALNRYSIMPATSAMSVPGRIGVQRLLRPRRCPTGGSTTGKVAQVLQAHLVSRYHGRADMRVLAGLLLNNTMF
ncbi:MAG: hypothetical protein ACLTEX_00765 [Eggerthella lenta]